MTLPPPLPFAPTLPPGSARVLPWACVMTGSLLATLPMVAKLPLMPPAGLLMLLAWRQLAPGALRVWAPSLLGLFDDLVSGQPLGSAMVLWQVATLLVALVDTRTLFRGFSQDWAIAAGLIAFCLVGGRLIASPLAARVDAALAVQIAIAALAFPFAARMVAWLDRKRGVAP